MSGVASSRVEPSGKAPTLQEVADAAGVSPATASNALSGNRAVSAVLRARVFAVANELGYPRIGETVRGRRTRRVTVGIVLPDVRNPAYAEVAHAFEQEGTRREWTIVLSSSSYDPARELEALESLVRTTDGVVVSPARPPLFGISDLAASPVPIVACDEPATSTLVGGTVRSDNFGGGRQAAHHLVDAGGTRFGMLGGEGYLPSTQERREGFLAGLRDRGVPEDAVHVVGATYGMDGGQATMYELLRIDPLVDAVFAVSDMHAVGALFEAQHAGRSIPEDLLLCGFDGIGWTQQISPTITTMRQDWPGIALRALDMLGDMMNGGSGQAAILPVTLVPGQSTSRSVALAPDRPPA